jgi:hypothetical protein
LCPSTLFFHVGAQVIYAPMPNIAWGSVSSSIHTLVKLFSRIFTHLCDIIFMYDSIKITHFNGIEYLSFFDRKHKNVDKIYGYNKTIN